MEEVRQLVQEEGREARNLVAFHVSVDPPGRPPPRKPPRCAPSARRAPPRAATRLRSASAGRDKRSELRARYWALLFGDLQRAVGEIYNTVEAHESLNECQEVILVLENYTRDFKALGEWFRLKWEYDNTPPPQRPQSLAWEIRKTDFVRLDNRRTSSVKSSPSVSGKNSPSLSGHNTPSGKNSPVTGKSSPGSGKISPRMMTSPKSNLEFFSNKIASKVANKPEAKTAKETQRLSDIKERDIKENGEEHHNDSPNESISKTILIDTSNASMVTNSCISSEPSVMLGTAKESSNVSPLQVVVTKAPNKISENLEDLSMAAKTTVDTLNSMENDFLSRHLCENKAKNDNFLNLDNATEKRLKSPLNGQQKSTAESPIKSEDNFADVSSESSPLSNEEKCLDNQKCCNDQTVPENSESATNMISNINKIEENVKTTADTNKDIDIHGKENSKKDDLKKLEPKTTAESKSCPRPAYSQAAAKPKLLTSKTDTKSTPIARSKTVIEMRPNPVLRNQKQYLNRKNQPNKCSYPFNLTTGRSSLFDTVPNKTTVPRKPIRAVHNLASGDAKPVNKIDIKRKPVRPVNLKVNEKGDKKEVANSQLERIKDSEEYNSSDSIVTQIDMTRIESSDSLKTLVPDDYLIPEDIANSIEVLNNVDNNKNDNDGWLTVKSRRLSRESKKHSKSHWANRFNQPSATTSLPTLNMIESPKQENKPFIEPTNHTPLNRAKSEQPQELEKKETTVKVAVKSKSDTKKSGAILRQKSDVTGLKTRSARSKALSKKDKKDRKHVDCELTKNRLHSSLESLTTGLSRSQESTEESFDFDKWKEEFKIKFKYLDEDDQMSDKTEILKSADPSEMSEIAEMTSQIEENEKKIGWALDFQSEVDQRMLSEEEDLLNRQIMDLQQVSDIDIDTETDDTETDAEIVIDDHTPCPPSPPGAQLGALAASLEDQYETALAGMSWAERVDTLVVLEALVARDPGRAQQLHAKLSQGIKRRGSLQDALRRLQAKQARAERQRLEYQTERAKKIHQLLARVEEVKVAKNQLIEEKRVRMERRLQKAAENRDQHLKDIVRKAHDEEEKLREIAFIKQLEAENRRHEFLDQCRSHTTRLRQVRRDRLIKLEEKAAREAAVVSRRSALEAARVLHMATLAERRREQHERLQQMKEMKSKEKGTHNRQKAEGVKSRLEALAAAAELEADALRSRIRDKQDASQQRLESHLQAIREKATGPRTTTSDTQEQTAKELEEEAERIEQERREKEKQKAIKKKARKIKQKLLATATEPVPDDCSDSGYIFTNNKLTRVLQQITNILAPLLDTDHKEDTARKNSLQNGIDVADIKNNKSQATNNNDQNKDANRDDEGKITKKSKKKKTSDNKLNEADKQNNVVQKAEIIVQKESSPENNSTESNNSRRVSPETETSEKDKVANNETAKKKNKRNKNMNKEVNDVNRPKLSKTSSVCSSLSDMSKTSSKSEKKVKTIVDTASLEKYLNELLRNMDSRFEKICQETFGRAHGLRVLSQLLTVAAEREDLRSQFSTKCLTSVVSALSRVMVVSGLIAFQIISSPIATNLVTFLTIQMEKDLEDLRELELAKQLSDCLSITLDAVLVSTRIYEEEKEEIAEIPDMLKTIRSRAHTLISYLCLSGSITRAEKSPARESILTLLTVCADLCHPCDADVGSERQSALQSLRTALGAGLCGSRAELCGLFARGAGLEQRGGFVRAARVAHLLRATAELDHQIVQEAFGEGGWPLEFRAAVARLLSQHAPSDKEAPRTSALSLSNQRLDQTLSEAMVLDLIVLVGFVVVNNPQLQETICEGWSVIKTLCTLPANWLVSKPQSLALLPTLIALSERPATAQVIASELSSDMLEEFLSSPESQKIKLIQVIKQGRAKKHTKK